MAKIALFALLLALLTSLVWMLPVLWELAAAGLIGGIYWIFFRIPPSAG